MLGRVSFTQSERSMILAEIEREQSVKGQIIEQSEKAGKSLHRVA